MRYHSVLPTFAKCITVRVPETLVVVLLWASGTSCGCRKLRPKIACPARAKNDKSVLLRQRVQHAQCTIHQHAGRQVAVSPRRRLVEPLQRRQLQLDMGRHMLGSIKWCGQKQETHEDIKTSR